MINHTALAESLWNAQFSGVPIPPLSEANPSMTVADAYEIQSINIERRINEMGLHGEKARLVGRKIGITSKAVQSIGGGVLLACLDKQISAIDAEPLALGIVAWHQHLQTAGEVTCVFRDSAFADDVAKTNLAAILEQHGIAKVRSL